MATFEIVAPNGKKYRVEGPTAAGAHSALMKMIGAPPPVASAPEAAGVAVGPSAAAAVAPSGPPNLNPTGQSLGDRRLNAAGTGVVNDINAGFQGANPVALSQQRPVGVVDRAPDGRIIAIDVDGVAEDPAKYSGDQYVTQIDPDTQMELVYLRTPENEAGPLESAGRILGQGVPLPTGPGGMTAAGRLAQEGSGLDQAAAAVGVTPSLGMRGPMGARLAGAAESNMITAGPVVRDSNRAASELAAAGRNIAETVGEPTTRAVAGDALKRGADAFSATTKGVERGLWDAVGRALPKGTKIDARQTALALEDMLGAFADTPNIGQSTGISSLKGWAQDIVANNGQLSWEQIKALRSEIGSALKTKSGPLAQDQAQGRLKTLYGTLTDDLGAGARAVGGPAETAWKRANNYTRARAKRLEDALDIFYKGNRSDEGTFDIVKSFGKDSTRGANIKKLSQIRRSMPDEEWQTFTSTIIDLMGRPTKGALNQDFSADVFLSAWNDISPAAKRIMFSGKGISPQVAKSLDQLAEVAEAAKAGGAELNKSRSGAVMGNLAALPAAGAGLMAEPFSTVALLALTRAGSEALSRPRFVRGIINAARGSNASLQRLARGDGPDAVRALNALRIIEQQGRENEGPQ